MSVEQTSPSVGAKAVAAGDGRNGITKGKAGANQGAGDAAPGGFMALLAAFDEPEATTKLPSALTTEVPDGSAAPALLLDKAATAEAPWSELSMLLGQKMPPDAQLLPNAQAPADAQVPVAAQILMSLQMPTDGSALAVAGEPALPKATASLAASYQPAGKPLTLPDPKTADLSRTDNVALKTSTDSPLPDMTNQGLTVPGRKSGSAQSALAASSAAETRALKPATFMDLVAKEPALSGALLGGGLGADVLSLAARAASRPISGVTATGLEGSFAQHALTPGGPVDVGIAAAGAVLTPESAVAEQVTYWASQGIQNAQLKLEGFGAEPIEVTISVKGQEAQIDFRTDQPELRQMLEGALVQLKEALAREGLVLSGVSVGSSGQEGAGAQDRRQRPNTRQATVTTQEASPTIGLQRASPVAGRSLDVFV